MKKLLAILALVALAIPELLVPMQARAAPLDNSLPPVTVCAYTMVSSTTAHLSPCDLSVSQDASNPSSYPWSVTYNQYALDAYTYQQQTINTNYSYTLVARYGDPSTAPLSENLTISPGVGGYGSFVTFQQLFGYFGAWATVWGRDYSPPPGNEWAFTLEDGNGNQSPTVYITFTPGSGTPAFAQPPTPTPPALPTATPLPYNPPSAQPNIWLCKLPGTPYCGVTGADPMKPARAPVTVKAKGSPWGLYIQLPVVQTKATHIKVQVNFFWVVSPTATSKLRACWGCGGVVQPGELYAKGVVLMPALGASTVTVPIWKLIQGSGAKIYTVADIAHQKFVTKPYTFPAGHEIALGVTYTEASPMPYGWVGARYLYLTFY